MASSSSCVISSVVGLGEMFALLSKQSVLRHGMTDAGTADQAAQDAAFDAALSDALSRPEQLATRLFTLRAEGLLTGLDPGIARARLSGMLVGIDLAANRAYWLGQPVLVEYQRRGRWAQP